MNKYLVAECAKLMYDQWAADMELANDGALWFRWERLDNETRACYEHAMSVALGHVALHALTGHYNEV